VTTATLSDENATLKINDSLATNGVAETVPLNPAGIPTVIDIEVTAEDGVTNKTYTITVNRVTMPTTLAGVALYN
jgi:hypothetical protein